MSEQTVLWGSDLVAETLRELEIPYFCINPGASFRGLHDSVVNRLGNQTPKMLVCLHEEHAVAIAHGYALVTERPLAVGTHANVGLMHASMAIFNAWCGRMPVIVLGATGPVDAAQRRPWIDWIHTCADQGALVRGFTKWDDQPASAEAAVESLRRASLLAGTHPRGPVYVNLDTTVQEGPAADVSRTDAHRYRAPLSPAPNVQDVEEAVALIKAAKRPLVLSGRIARTDAAWAARLAFVERLGAPVVTSVNDPASIPSSHPLHAGEVGMRMSREMVEAIAASDVIISLDWLDLGGTLSKAFGDTPVTAKIIQASPDLHIHRGWSMDYQSLPPVDVAITATPETTIDALMPHLADLEPVAARLSRPPMTEVPESDEISVPFLAEAVRNALAKRAATVVTRPIGWPLNANDWNGPLDFLGRDGGGGLGSGPGMTVGAALAVRDRNAETGENRLAVGILGDGDLLMGINALWSAAAERIPMLIITSNNRSYFNDVIHQRHVATERDRDVSRAFIGQELADPLPDIAGLARAQGLAGFGPVTDPAALTSELDQAIEAVDAGESVVLDVHVRREYSS